MGRIKYLHFELFLPNSKSAISGWIVLYQGRLLAEQGGLGQINCFQQTNILIFSSLLQSTMAEYLSYEETTAFIEATKWKGYNFLSSEDVYKSIAAIPDELYSEEPQGQLKEQESETVAATSKEMSKARSVAKILNLVDKQKAAAIKDYVITKFGRQLVKTHSEDQNFFPVSAHAIGEQGING